MAINSARVKEYHITAILSGPVGAIYNFPFWGLRGSCSGAFFPRGVRGAILESDIYSNAGR